MADNGNNDNVFIYMGGDQRVPERMSLMPSLIAPSILSLRGAFRRCYYLVSIEMHDEVKTIEMGGYATNANLSEP